MRRRLCWLGVVRGGIAAELPKHQPTCMRNWGKGTTPHFPTALQDESPLQAKFGALEA